MICDDDVSAVWEVRSPATGAGLLYSCQTLERVKREKPGGFGRHAFAGVIYVFGLDGLVGIMLVSCRAPVGG